MIVAILCLARALCSDLYMCLYRSMHEGWKPEVAFIKNQILSNYNWNVCVMKTQANVCLEVLHDLICMIMLRLH